MYVSDILAVDFLHKDIKNTIYMSLLSFSYLPFIVNSLVIIQNKK